jgi:molecular chaperone GrpE
MIDELNDQPELDQNGGPADGKPARSGEMDNSNENEVELLKQQLQEANDKFLRLFAEFDNYKRRTMKEKSEILQTAGKDVILALLPVIDDFERAKRASESIHDIDTYKEGIDLIYQKFHSILQAKGLKPIDSIGVDFNVDLHEAITNVPVPSEDMKGKVIDETEKGYILNGHVIRFAKVVVGE